MSKKIKKVIYIIVTIIIFPAIILSIVEKKISKRNDMFVFFGQLFSLLPGIFGNYFRVVYYRWVLDECPFSTYIGFGSYFSQSTAIVKKNVNIGAYCILGTVDLGKNVMIASRVSITSGKRQHIDDNGKVNKAVFFPTRVSIGEGSWIGEGAVIMDNIGSNCIISAGSVVARKSANNILGAGNPARFYKPFK